MPRLKITTLERLKTAIKAFESSQAKYSEFGAQDAEPDWVFQKTLATAVSGAEVVMPTSPRDWQLFASSMNCGVAARGLTAACRKAVNIICSVKVAELPEIKKYLSDYCWRVHVD